MVNVDFAARLGVAVGRWLPKRGTVLIGRDTRQSGPALEVAVARGLRMADAEPVSLGILATPAVARAVRIRKAVLGLVVTASHNPATDNGIKLFGPGGLKLSDADELEIEQLLPERVPDVERVGQVSPAEADGLAVADYVAVAQGVLAPGSLAGWRIALDTANGSTCRTSPVVLQALGAELTLIGDAPDGRNINLGVGSENPGALAACVGDSGMRLGIAHDGDGDRCVLCDERGQLLDGDEILTLLAVHALENGRLARQVLVVTQQSNLGVDAAVAAAGGRVVRTSVGDRYVVERMRAEGASIGGESSGHIIFREYSTTGDGLIAALKVIEIMLATGCPLSDLRRRLRKFPQRILAVPVREKIPLGRLPALAATMRVVEGEIGPQGRVFVRYSGTENKLRLLVEGPDDRRVEAGMERLRAAVAEEGLDRADRPAP